MNIRVGDWVKWKSQSRGTTTEKVGVVVSKVPARLPVMMDWKLCNHVRLDPRHFSLGKLTERSTKTKDSFLIAVPGKTKKQKATLYWPHPHKLEKVQKRRKNDPSRH